MNQLRVSFLHASTKCTDNLIASAEAFTVVSCSLYATRRPNKNKTALCAVLAQSCTEDKTAAVLAQQFELQRQTDMMEWSESFLKLQRSVLPPADYLAAW